MDYDTWLTTHPSEYDYDPYEDYVHVDELTKYDDATNHIKEMINSFYQTGDLHKFETAFEELSAVFDINLPYANPKFIPSEINNNKVPTIKIKIKIIGD